MPFKDPEKRKAYYAARKGMQAAHSKKWYEAHKKEHIERVKKYKEKYIDDRCRYVHEYLDTHPCIDCGEDDIVVLEFDHRDRSDKSFTIGLHRRLVRSMQELIDEIVKCDIRCANCHRRKTAIEGGYRRARYCGLID